MKECAGLVVKLIGGPNDGEDILMNPCPGVGPPQHLTFYSGKQPYNLDVYELWPPVPCWPDAGTGTEYQCGDKMLMDVVTAEAHWQGRARFDYAAALNAKEKA